MVRKHRKEIIPGEEILENLHVTIPLYIAGNIERISTRTYASGVP